MLVAEVEVEVIIARFVIVEVALLARMPPERVARPVAERVPVMVVLPAAMVPMLTRLPDESMRLVPAPAPVLMAVVPLMVVPVMVLAKEATPATDRAPVICASPWSWTLLAVVVATPTPNPPTM